jgi:hypothetical protein
MSALDKAAMSREARNVVPEPRSSGQELGMPVSDRILMEAASRSDVGREFANELKGAL